MSGIISYGEILAYNEGFTFYCAVCASPVGGFSGPPPDEYPPRMQLAVHTLPCPACGAGEPPPDRSWPKGKPRPLP